MIYVEFRKLRCLKQDSVPYTNVYKDTHHYDWKYWSETAATSLASRLLSLNGCGETLSFAARFVYSLPFAHFGIVFSVIRNLNRDVRTARWPFNLLPQKFDSSISRGILFVYLHLLIRAYPSLYPLSRPVILQQSDLRRRRALSNDRSIQIYAILGW